MTAWPDLKTKTDCPFVVSLLQSKGVNFNAQPSLCHSCMFLEVRKASYAHLIESRLPKTYWPTGNLASRARLSKSTQHAGMSLTDREAVVSALQTSPKQAIRDLHHQGEDIRLNSPNVQVLIPDIDQITSCLIHNQLFVGKVTKDSSNTIASQILPRGNWSWLEKLTHKQMWSGRWSQGLTFSSKKSFYICPMAKACPGGGLNLDLAAHLQLQELPDYLKKDCLLFYFPEMEQLAERIAQASTKIELGRIRWAWAPTSPWSHHVCQSMSLHAPEIFF